MHASRICRIFLCEADPDEISDSDDEVEEKDDYDIDEFELDF